MGENRRSVKSRTIFLDRHFWAALVCGPVFWALLVATGTPLQSIQRLQGHLPAVLMIALVYPVLEEIVFRGGLQEWLARRDSRAAWKGLSRANLLTSLLFSAAHLWHQPPLWAASVFFPSLIFGYFKDRHATLYTPIVLHVFYNTGYALMFINFQ